MTHSALTGYMVSETENSIGLVNRNDNFAHAKPFYIPKKKMDRNLSIEQDTKSVAIVIKKDGVQYQGIPYIAYVEDAFLERLNVDFMDW